MLILQAGARAFAGAPAPCIDYRSHLHWLSRVDAPEYATAVAVANGFAFMTDGKFGLVTIDIADPAAPVFDVTTPESPRIVGGAATGGASGVAVSRAAGIVAVASGKGGLQLFPVQCAW
jgi:hypothetical protein